MSGVARPDDVRRRNRSQILQCLRRSGPISRTDLCERTGLSQSTVSAITAVLLADGTLRPSAVSDQGEPRRGRPQVALEFNPHKAAVAAIALSYSRLTGALFDYAGNEIAACERLIDTHRTDAHTMIDQCGSIIAELVSALAPDAGDLQHVSIGVQGVTDAAMTTMLWSPITPALDVAFSRALSKQAGVPVQVDNDCNLIAEALKWSSAFEYQDNFAAIIFGYGIGMGLYLGGNRFSGVRSSAMEFGHMSHIPDGAQCRCGAKGCVEAYAADYAIFRNAVAGTEPDFTGLVARETIAELAQRARRGDGPERDAFRAAGSALGTGLRSLFSLIDPVPIAFVGSGTTAIDLMDEAMQSAIASGGPQYSAQPLRYTCYPDTRKLVLSGCAMQSLSHVDDGQTLNSSMASHPMGVSA
jgi:predicted NBD/HSP70 family sugar kinase